MQVVSYSNLFRTAMSLNDLANAYRENDEKLNEYDKAIGLENGQY